MISPIVTSISPGILADLVDVARSKASQLQQRLAQLATAAAFWGHGMARPRRQGAKAMDAMAENGQPKLRKSWRNHENRSKHHENSSRNGTNMKIHRNDDDGKLIGTSWLAMENHGTSCDILCKLWTAMGKSSNQMMLHYQTWFKQYSIPSYDIRNKSETQ